MKVDIWMPLYVKDYLGDTMHLTPEGHGIYLLLIVHYWINRGPIADDIKALANVTRTDNVELLKSIISEFFTLSNGELVHFRIDKELKLSISRRESASNNGKKGGRPPKEKTHSFNEGKPTENPTPNPQKSSSSSSSSSSLRTSTPTPSREEKRTRKRFQKPTMEELKAYSISISFQDFDTEKFLDYYESNGWKVGKNQMADWKATVRGWKKNGYDKQAGSKTAYKHGGEINFEL